MNDLEKLGKKYGTDKIGKHNYLPYYYDLFKDRRESVEKVLEIGAGEGHGLRMFRDFFPNAMIYGAEIDNQRLFKENRIWVYWCDQSRLDDLIDLIDEYVGSNLDFCIDDGSHKPEDQLFTCLVMMSLIKKQNNPNFVYIIEDVADDGIVKYLKKYDVKVIKCGKRYDDRLIIVKHK